MEITKVFLTQIPWKSNVRLGDSLVAVGVEGKQLWKEITPNLNRALRKLFGNPPRKTYGYPKESTAFYVWPIEDGIYNWGGDKIRTKFEVFAHWQKYKMHTRIILKKNGTFSIRKPGL